MLPDPSPPPPPPRGSRGRTVGLVVAVLLAAWGLGLPGRALAALRDDHAFLRTAVDGRPVAWDNCRAIHYVVNPQGAPADWPALLDDALAEISRHSGYVFVRDGTTTDRRFRSGRGLGDPVLVGWAVRSEIGRIGEGAAGLGGPVTFETPTGPRYGSGMIAFDALGFARLTAAGRRGDTQMIVEHEWMHVLGLAHADDPTQVMSASGHYVGEPALGDGDIAGLRALRAVPCPGAAG